MVHIFYSKQKKDKHIDEEVYVGDQDKKILIKTVTIGRNYIFKDYLTEKL